MRTLEEQVAFLSGQVTGLMHMCVAIVAVSTIRPLIADAFRQLSSIVPEGRVSPELESHYKDGIASVAEDLQGLLKSGALPRSRSPQGPDGRS